ncbi:activator of 90 kDa heat shock protein ATPase homolog 1b isoform X1 [Phyllopteryx taeniolatus]|uniref:activator of 90 kDa heat shock protein ATPase homolog 1b isoform X1 n=2 Tax=Phyllopteryx taeniolatus TaxID=161469 RepID=UPI002AD2B344|nr:activator of 90 kDa heat shock protein ATPase homolog 1b isoform X1 [Phyllopteryx taeniolatus]
MAKWGEGDPRWIVEERADATNVNNWHWTERDATSWSSDKLKSLLLGLRVENDEGSCEVTEVSKVEGEASINNRKGKLIFFYEWNLKATWTGMSKAGIKYQGSVEIPNLSDENDMDDLDISVSLNKDEPETPLVHLMKSKGAENIRQALGNYVGFLKSEFTQGMILPTANGVVQLQSSQSKAKTDKTRISSSSSSSAAAVNTGVKIPTCKFTMTETFLTSPADLYRVFVNQEMTQAFTHAPATVAGEKGGMFRLLGGNVLGQFTELVRDQKIVMKWRYNNWPCEHYATVTLTFVDRSSETELRVDCRGVPDDDEDWTKDGWRRFYFEAIKQTFGFGARLF